MIPWRESEESKAAKRKRYAEAMDIDTSIAKKWERPSYAKESCLTESKLLEAHKERTHPYDLIIDHMLFRRGHMLLERRGLPDAVVDAATKATRYFFDHYHKGDKEVVIDPSVFNDTFLYQPKVSVKIEDADTFNGGYIPKNAELINTKDGVKLKGVEVVVYTLDTGYNIGYDISMIFHHEFTHAYQDFNILQKEYGDTKSFKNLFDYEKKAAINFTELEGAKLDERIAYYRKYENPIVKQVGDAAYIMCTHELNAFIAQACVEIKNINYWRYLSPYAMIQQLTIFDMLCYLIETKEDIVKSRDSNRNLYDLSIRGLYDFSDAKDSIGWFIKSIDRTVNYIYGKLARCIEYYYRNEKFSLTVKEIMDTLREMSKNCRNKNRK